MHPLYNMRAVRHAGHYNSIVHNNCNKTQFNIDFGRKKNGKRELLQVDGGCFYDTLFSLLLKRNLFIGMCYHLLF